LVYTNYVPIPGNCIFKIFFIFFVDTILNLCFKLVIETTTIGLGKMENTNMTKDQFFVIHAPDFNFELNAEELIELALKKDFIYKNEDGFYNYK
jgi:hypothetical protein